MRSMRSALLCLYSVFYGFMSWVFGVFCCRSEAITTKLVDFERAQLKNIEFISCVFNYFRWTLIWCFIRPIQALHNDIYCIFVNMGLLKIQNLYRNSICMDIYNIDCCK